MKNELQRQKLRDSFEQETGTSLINHDGEFDFDYIIWLEDQILDCSRYPK